MRRFNFLTAMTVALLISAPAGAADFSDPTWPCIQRKVERLSPALMWRFPLPEAPAAAALADDAAALGDALSLRRMELETLRPRVAAYAERHGGDKDALARAFQRSFLSLNKRRTRIMSGIGDFSLSQIKLAERIDATRAEMDRLTAAAEPDYDSLDALEEKLDWDQVIYTDRQRSITYLCETPQLIEKRLFAIAQLLAEHVRETE